MSPYRPPEDCLLLSFPLPDPVGPPVEGAGLHDHRGRDSTRGFFTFHLHLKRHPTPDKTEAYTRSVYTTPGCPEPCSCTCGVHEAAEPSEGGCQSSSPQFSSTARGRPCPTTPHSKFEPGRCAPCARFASGCHISPESGKDGISVARAIRAECQRHFPRWHRSRWPRKRCCLVEARRAGVPRAAF